MDKSFDVAFKKFVDARLEEVFKKKDFNQNIDGLIAAIERMLKDNDAEQIEYQNDIVTEIVQDHVYSNLHFVFQSMYEKGFIDGLYLEKQIKGNESEC